jgi:hypothetical protein
MLVAQNELKEIRPLSDWQVQVLRFTAFYDPEEQFDISGWWAELTGDMPETETKKVKEGISIEEGPFMDGRLTLTKSQIAIDLRFQLPNKPPNEVNGIPTIGSFEEQYPVFIGLVKKIFDVMEFPSIRRMAFGSIINLPSKDRQEGYKQLSAYIKNVKIDPVNSSEFFYRINRQRNSTTGIEGLEINRLNTWSVAAYWSVSVSASIPKGQVKTTEPNYACQLEIDINTCQEFQNNLPKEKLSEIFDELVGMGKEIICQGDIE